MRVNYAVFIKKLLNLTLKIKPKCQNLYARHKILTESLVCIGAFLSVGIWFVFHIKTSKLAFSNQKLQNLTSNYQSQNVNICSLKNWLT